MRRFLGLLAAILLMASLSCNYSVFAAPSPSPSPTPSPIAPPPSTLAAPAPTSTPTAQPAEGSICVLAYEDANGNAMRDGEERSLPGVLFSLQRGQEEIDAHVSQAAQEPFCFVNLPPASYVVQAVPPDSFRGTNPTNLSITLSSDERIPVILGFEQAEGLPDGKLLPDQPEAAVALVGDARAGNSLYLVTMDELQRTDDGGRTWSVMGERPPAETVVMSPADPSHLLAGNGFPCFRDGQPAPLFISTDSGESWEESPAGENLRPAAAHPTNPSVAWAVGCDGAYVTDDAGLSWEHQPSDAWGLYTLETIQPVMGQPDVVYAAGNSEGGSGALFRSTDGGRTWQTLTEDPELWITALLAHPTDADEVWFATPSGVWHSQDGGERWSHSAAGLETVAVGDDYLFEGRGLHALVRTRSSLLYLGTEQGVFQSEDGGVNWRAVRGTAWEQEPILRLLVSEATSHTRLWVTAQSGVYVYTPAGP